MPINLMPALHTVAAIVNYKFEITQLEMYIVVVFYANIEHSKV